MSTHFNPIALAVRAIVIGAAWTLATAPVHASAPPVAPVSRAAGVIDSEALAAEPTECKHGL